ncbi:MAG TPA: hypothetical protein VFG14_13950, partial [Chthoniobacteraceae bacterium]|nr:hypothetical protein [Chthoniobacteraceae bacterium]
MRLPLRQALPKIGCKTRGRLVAVLGRLAEKLHHYCRDWPRDSPDSFAGRHGLACIMTVHPFHRICGCERQHPRQHFVESDAERI